MKLSENQRKQLRRLGHGLKPAVTIGAAGLSDAVLAEIDSTLEHHELVKLRIRGSDRAARDQLIEAVLDRARAALVQRIGNVALLYRPAEEPKLTLPTGST